MNCPHSLSVGIGSAALGDAVYLNNILAALVPPGVVTNMLAMP